MAPEVSSAAQQHQHQHQQPAPHAALCVTSPLFTPLSAASSAGHNSTRTEAVGAAAAASAAAAEYAGSLSAQRAALDGLWNGAAVECLGVAVVTAALSAAAVACAAGSSPSSLPPGSTAASPSSADEAKAATAAAAATCGAPRCSVRSAAAQTSPELLYPLLERHLDELTPLRGAAVSPVPGEGFACGAAAAAAGTPVGTTAASGSEEVSAAATAAVSAGTRAGARASSASSEAAAGATNLADSRMRSELKMIVASYAVREEGLTARTASALAEARRYQAILQKLEKDNQTKRRRQDKALAESLEKQAHMHDKLDTLSAELSKAREDAEGRLGQQRESFRHDLMEVEELYRRDCAQVRASCLQEGDAAHRLRVRTREEVLQAGRDMEREACRQLLETSHAQHKRTTDELKACHEAVLREAREEGQYYAAELRTAAANAAHERDALCKQVEYLFEYSRNLAKIILAGAEGGGGGGGSGGSSSYSVAADGSVSRSVPRKRAAGAAAAAAHTLCPAFVPPGVTLFSKKKFALQKQAKAAAAAAAAAPDAAHPSIPALDFSLLHHVQRCWQRTQQYLQECRGVDLKREGYQPSLIDFPLYFVSAEDFADTTSSGGNAWTRKEPRPESVDLLLRNITECGAVVSEKIRAAAEARERVTKGCVDNADAGGRRREESLEREVSGLKGRLADAQRELGRYRDQCQREISRNKDMRISFDSAQRVIASLRSQAEIAPRIPCQSQTQRRPTLPRRPASASATHSYH